MQAAGAGRVAGLVQLLGGVAGQSACPVKVAALQLDSGQISEQDGALLDGRPGHLGDSTGQCGTSVVQAAGLQRCVPGEARQSGAVVVVEPRQLAGEGARAVERLAGAVDRDQRGLV